MGLRLARQQIQTIRHFYPDIIERFDGVPDPRAWSEYSMSEILMGAVSMFLFKQGSRNAINNNRYVNQFKVNYQSMWGLRLSHLDTVDAVLRVIEPEELGRVNAKLVSHLISQKVWDKNKLNLHTLVDNSGI